MTLCMDRGTAELYLLKPQDKRVLGCKTGSPGRVVGKLCLCIGKCSKIYGHGQNVVAHREFTAGGFGINHRIMNVPTVVQEKKEKKFPLYFLMGGK